MQAQITPSRPLSSLLRLDSFPLRLLSPAKIVKMSAVLFWHLLGATPTKRDSVTFLGSFQDLQRAPRHFYYGSGKTQSPFPYTTSPPRMKCLSLTLGTAVYPDAVSFTNASFTIRLRLPSTRRRVVLRTLSIMGHFQIDTVSFIVQTAKPHRQLKMLALLILFEKWSTSPFSFFAQSSNQTFLALFRSCDKPKIST